MKISATEAGQAETALLFLAADGRPGPWLLLDSSGVIVRGQAGEPLPAAARSIVAVPGEQVAIHWLQLADGLALPQAAAAARLLLADSSTEPMADLHVAVGRREAGRTPIALLPSRQMVRWLASAGEAGLDPLAMVPTSMLLSPPPLGFVNRDRGDISDYRGEASAFSLEPSLSDFLLSGAEVESLSVERFESDLPGLLADLPLDLRQGPFARRRGWRLERGRIRRLVALALAFLLLTLVVQVTLVLRYTFAADALDAEARALAAPAGASGSDFTGVAGALFNAVQLTANVEMTSLDYRAGIGLTAGVQADSAASLAALLQRAQASGLAAELGPSRNIDGRQAAELTVRP